MYARRTNVTVTRWSEEGRGVTQAMRGRQGVADEEQLEGI